MTRRFCHLSIIVLTGILMLEQLSFIYLWQNDPVYVVQWAEEGEKKSDQKEQEEKSSDDKKFNSLIQYFLNGSLTAGALHLIAERKYSAPPGEINSPPPEVFHS